MFEHLVTPEIATLVPYPPGKPIEEVERELGLTDIIKLASNENPLGPSPKALAALAATLPKLHRYPDAGGYALRRALAALHGLNPGNIVLGNGSDEIIELIVRAFVRPGQQVVFSNPTFIFYAKVAQAAGARIVEVLLRDFRHDLAGLWRAVREDTRVIFLDNPNNPTGSLVPRRDLEAFISDLPRTVVLALDEAYRDFVRGEDQIDPLAYIGRDRPVIFMRTFSKAYGLAGLRVGYGLGHEELMSYLDRIRQPFNMNLLAQAGALAALEDREFYEKTRQTTWSGLDFLYAGLDDLGVRYHRTQTNYFLIDVGRSADEVMDGLLHEGVIVRSMSSYGLSQTIRLTVGLPAENERFLRALKKVLGL